MSAAEELHRRGVRIEELRAQNAKLVAALEDIKRYANDHDDEWVPERVDRALAAAGHTDRPSHSLADPRDGKASMSEFDGPIMATLVQNNDALRAQNAKLVAALVEIAKQKLVSEMADVDEAVHADFEGGYEECISRSRAALAAARRPQGSGEADDGP